MSGACAGNNLNSLRKNCGELRKSCGELHVYFPPKVTIIGGYGVKFRQGLQFPILNWPKNQKSSRF